MEETQLKPNCNLFLYEGKIYTARDLAKVLKTGYVVYNDHAKKGDTEFYVKGHYIQVYRKFTKKKEEETISDNIIYYSGTYFCNGKYYYTSNELATGLKIDRKEIIKYVNSEKKEFYIKGYHIYFYKKKRIYFNPLSL